jgi:WD40 repeat protein
LIPFLLVCRLYEGATGQLLLELKLHKDAVVGLDMSPAGMESCVIHLVVMTRLTTGDKIITGCKDKHARLFDTRTGELLFDFNAVRGASLVNLVTVFGHVCLQEARCYAVQFSPDGERIAVGDDGNKVCGVGGSLPLC